MLTTIKQLWDEQADAYVAAGRLEDDPDIRNAFVKRKVRETIDTAKVLLEKSAPERTPTPIAVPLARGGSVPTTRGQRGTIPTSSWDTPARSTMSSTDPDTIVPPFYIERKKQRDSISERKEEEGELMYELSAGILSDDFSAHHRVREEKIPVEVQGHDGVMRHPSGFEPPTAETDFHPTAAKPAEAPPKSLWAEVSTPKGARGFHYNAFLHGTVVPYAQFRGVSAALANPPTPPTLSASTAAEERQEFDEDTDVDG